MKTPAPKRQSKRVSNTENLKPTKKGRGCAPLPVNGRTALRNISNQSKNINKEASKQNYGVKKTPNYLKPTFSTLQKCTKKKIKPFDEKPACKDSSGLSVPKNESHKDNSADSSVTRVSENIFDFDEDLEGQELERTCNQAGKEPKTSEKEAKPDFASPLRIELAPVRKILPATPKPPVNKVLSILKSSLSSPLVKTPRTVEKKLPEFFKTPTPQSPVQQATSSALLVDDVLETFDRPPRRSYSRPRPLTDLSTLDEPNSDEDDKVKEQEIKVVEEKECKRNPKKRKKTTKATAQDKQFEELAAAMNSQFSQVEDFQLVVE
ncbi:unnamed protein product [Bemisia tabaci]|uniref:Uncharacterized protein n=1 Tax=Bemisia tabaci TaxID=7038 RepID=A0A9P0A385_BEMTA|nr:unnamed protein product [Bemisia tabaci]